MKDLKKTWHINVLFNKFVNKSHIWPRLVRVQIFRLVSIDQRKIAVMPPFCYYTKLVYFVFKFSSNNGLINNLAVRQRLIFSDMTFIKPIFSSVSFTHFSINLQAN